MRALLLPVMLAVLTACGEARNPAASDAEAAEAIPLTGAFYAASETARTITGNVEIAPRALSFEKGMILYTATLAPRGAGDFVDQGGQTYAAAALGASDLSIELRRVTEEVAPNGAGRGPSLCADAPATYITLAYGPRAVGVTLLVFSGSDAPGPNSSNSRLCASYAYAAPEGARTRQGVVLR